MNLLSDLFRKNMPLLAKSDGTLKTSGELFAEVSNGANLVDGKQTWELADEKKQDLEYMKKCCDAELRTMAVTGIVAAPYYFERVAVLSRKLKDYEQEIHYCELYIHSVEAYYAKHGTANMADVRKGPRYQSILARLPKAKDLLSKSTRTA